MKREQNRSNEEWVSDLSGDGDRREAALGDLRRLLMNGLRRSVGGSALEDYVQAALIRITGGLGSFRGDSRFETWALSIGVRVAVSEMRRARWREVSLDEMVEAGRLFPAEQAVNHESNQLMQVVHEAIQAGLTAKQREAILAELGGAPPDEVARRLGTNRNALYKLVYDARARIRQAILQAGWTEEQVLGVLGGR
ncbi:MAG: sigma-70 family RNA polymerase sigma factor [Bryobacteraceae bacterium]|nr:sigma-70 family RNA polymerase sigma factor [Bryobacteraceae bacterium]